MGEKDGLLGSHSQEAGFPTPSQRRSWTSRIKTTIVTLILVAVVVYQFRNHLSLPSGCTGKPKYEPQCPPQEVIGPKSRPDITSRNVETLFKSSAFRNLSVERLSRAVQIPTEDFDDMGPVGEDDRWDIFYDLQKYFEKTFPLFHEKLEQDIINSHGLVYTWRGSDSSLQPILLTGHQDTVPVAADTLDQWTHDPFSGYFDGKYINGRGANDCKNNVIALFSTITALLEADFQPRRTVVLAFGFDEESPHGYGALQIAKHLEKVWGQNSFAIMVDEGVLGINKYGGRTFGTPQASEKGYMNALIRVHVPGGHSSMAPPHTSIGILSEVVTALENNAGKNFPSRLSSNNPFYYQLHCAAEDPHTDISPELRHALKKPNGNDEVVELLKGDFSKDIMLRTSQAVTIFNSGNKANALPQYAQTLVDYRISNEQSVSDLHSALIETIEPVAKKHGLKFLTREESDNSTSHLPEHTLSVSWWRSLEPSPVSSHKSPSWKYFSGVIKHVFDEEGEGKDVLVTPTIAQGGTDTKYFWNLTGQIYRFGPMRSWHDEGWGGVHDVNERVALDGHLEAILFFHEFIRVFDEADLEG
ncbi:related to CPS1-gly-X carboxypeptidase YSCS precursor [Phialocephala subalpina]|uniref:Related to CPS1-gly-X carboxypeptidase YSCS n=1 Tax=Phialocephala subalpina TaxID=576137 RepID=A0A1L7XQI1_9HELO|nr:related to CPS1-gly-X carboxypeptidase YSCS precursor [Phialocephala subalpina]